MRQSIAIIAVGLISGTLGAVITSRLAAPPPPPPPRTVAPPGSQPAPVVIVPPGWDPSLLGRLEAVEREQELQRGLRRDAGQSNPAAMSADDSEGAEGEDGRLEFYRQELAAQEERFEDHRREPLDMEWARDQSRSLTEALSRPSASTNSPKVLDVDCRSSTCTAKLSFNSPIHGLEFINGRPDSFPRDCKGMIAVPPPPTSAGQYEMSLIFRCR